jgi:hypothetical protein
MPEATLCPSHNLPLDRKRSWTPTADAFMCAECESQYLARRAWLDELPVVDDPFEALTMLFSDPRV